MLDVQNMTFLIRSSFFFGSLSEPFERLKDHIRSSNRVLVGGCQVWGGTA